MNFTDLASCFSNMSAFICRAADHSLVVVTVRLSPGDIPLEPNNSAHSSMNAERTAVLNVNACNVNSTDKPRKKYDLSSFSEHFMSNTRWAG